MAERFAKDFAHKLKVYKADWKKHGLKAGPLRNTQIVENCNIMIAFPSSKGKGTQDSIRKAEKNGIKVEIFWID